MLFHLVLKIYMEGVRNYCEDAYQYADLCRLMPRMAEAEIAFFADRLRVCNLQATGYYVLRRLQTHFSVSLPQALADLIEEWAIPEIGSAPAQQND